MWYKKSFTLIELLIVLLILSLIVGIVVPIGNNLLNRINLYLKNKEKKNLIKIEKYKCFLKEEENKTLKINRFGIEKSFFNN